jgi:hypothetical protein
MATHTLNNGPSFFLRAFALLAMLWTLGGLASCDGHDVVGDSSGERGVYRGRK